jgi:hypothetical protein
MYGNPGDVLDRNSLSEMNLKVLKRIDPYTEEVRFVTGSHIPTNLLDLAEVCNRHSEIFISRWGR